MPRSATVSRLASSLISKSSTRGRHARAPSVLHGGNFARNRPLVERIEAIAGDKGCISRSSCLPGPAQGPHVIPIPGTKHIARLEENLGAVRVRLRSTASRQRSRPTAPPAPGTRRRACAASISEKTAGESGAAPQGQPATSSAKPRAPRASASRRFQTFPPSPRNAKVRPLSRRSRARPRIGSMGYGAGIPPTFDERTTPYPKDVGRCPTPPASKAVMISVVTQKKRCSARN
jgi:hypothetical protein